MRLRKLLSTRLKPGQRCSVTGHLAKLGRVGHSTRAVQRSRSRRGERPKILDGPRLRLCQPLGTPALPTDKLTARMVDVQRALLCRTCADVPERARCDPSAIASCQGHTRQTRHTHAVHIELLYSLPDCNTTAHQCLLNCMRSPLTEWAAVFPHSSLKRRTAPAGCGVAASKLRVAGGPGAPPHHDHLPSNTLQVTVALTVVIAAAMVADSRAHVRHARSRTWHTRTGRVCLLTV